MDKNSAGLSTVDTRIKKKEKRIPEGVQIRQYKYLKFINILKAPIFMNCPYLFFI